MRKVGRPTDFRPEFLIPAQKLSKLGATDMEIADFFGVDVRTIYRWKATNKKFCQSLKAGKKEADDRVERSLFQRAVGFEHDSVKIFLPKDATEPVYAPYREYIPPDTTAGIFWLKNRREKEWRDRIQQEISGEMTLKAVLVPVLSTERKPDPLPAFEPKLLESGEE